MNHLRAAKACAIAGVTILFAAGFTSSDVPSPDARVETVGTAGEDIPNDLSSNVLKKLVSLEAQDASGTAISSQLTRLLGTEVRFIPRQGDTISIAVKDFPVEELLRALERQGDLAITMPKSESATPPKTESPWLERRVTLQVHDSKASVVSDLLTSVLGTEIAFTSEPASRLVSLDAKNISVGELLQALSTQGQVRAPALGFP